MFALAQQHWNETQAYRHNQPFAPDFARYERFYQAGALLPFTARDDVRMVGYGGVFLTPSMLTQRPIALEENWYLLPDYRKGWTALKFFKFMEAECRKRGAEDLTLTVPDQPAFGVICRRLGYKKTALHYNKQFTP